MVVTLGIPSKGGNDSSGRRPRAAVHAAIRYELRQIHGQINTLCYVAQYEHGDDLAAGGLGRIMAKLIERRRELVAALGIGGGRG